MNQIRSDKKLQSKEKKHAENRKFPSFSFSRFVRLEIFKIFLGTRANLVPEPIIS